MRLSTLVRHLIPLLLFPLLTLRAGTPAADAIVSSSGDGTHTTVQAAVDACPANSTRDFVILVKPGTYREHLVVPAERPRIVLMLTAEEAKQLTVENVLGGKDGWNPRIHE